MKPSVPASAYEPGLVAKILALRGVQPFDRLPIDELTLLAEVARPKAYPPGAALQSVPAVMDRLQVVVGGGVSDSDGRTYGPLLGVRSLVAEVAVPALTVDSAAGAQVLEISKRHFFTLAHECPEFVLGLIELGDGGRSGPA